MCKITFNAISFNQLRPSTFKDVLLTISLEISLKPYRSNDYHYNINEVFFAALNTKTIQIWHFNVVMNIV